MKNQKGYGLGKCPGWKAGRHRTLSCACGASRCRVCGNLKHMAIHMHRMGEKPGDPPWGHEYVPSESPKQTGASHD